MTDTAVTETATTAVITGASSGIGREIALQAVKSCDTLVLTARREERLRELADELRRRRPDVDARVWPADLARESARRELAAGLESEGLVVDWLVNNAGFGLAGRSDEIDAGRLQTMLEVNVVALQHLTLLFLPGMVERRRGGVLNVASTAAYQPIPYMATYAASKAFVLSFSEALWQELRGTGVTATCLCPGRTATEFFDGANMDTTTFDKAPAASAEEVARAGWQGLLDGRRTVIPGLSNRLGAQLAPVLPRRAVLTVGEKLFKP